MNNGIQSFNLNAAVHGIIVPLVTPLERDEKLDREALERVIEHVIGGGVSVGV